jgi:hypothetical protein
MRQLYGFMIVATLVGCDMQLDREKLVGEIKSTLKEKGVPDARVECPEVKKMKKGGAFECTGEAFGKPIHMSVNITDDKGTVSWELFGKIVETAKLAAFVEPKITEQLKSPAKVTCADKMAVLAPKDSITCDIVVDGATSKVALTVAENGDDVHWKLVK